MSDASSKSWWGPVIALTAAATAARIALSAAIPLSADEAYYWEWSRRLDFGYFDHPPMVAWMIAASRAVFGDSELGIRMLPVLLSAAGGFLLFDLARRTSGSGAAAFAAVAAAQATPLFAFGGVFATPDAPLVFFWVAGVHAAWLAISRKSAAWWLAAGALSGLAMTSKYTGVLFPFSILAYALSSRERRRLFRTPGPWLSVLAGAAVFSPVLAWNASHGFASFAFQLGHGLKNVDGYFGRGVVEMLGSQAGIITPPMMLLCAWAVARAGRDAISRGHDPSMFHFAQVAAVFGVLGFAGLFARGEGNWVAPGWPAAFVLAGPMIADFLSAGAARWKKAFAASAVAIALGFSLFSGVQSAFSVLALGKDDPTNKVYGWPQIGEWVDGVIDANFSSAPETLITDRYQIASSVTYYSKHHPFVFPEEEEGSGSQYMAWKPAALPGRTLYISWYDKDEYLENRFGSVRLVSTYELRRRGKLLRTMRAWVVSEK